MLALLGLNDRQTKVNSFNCPACGLEMKTRKLRKGWSHSCQAGCGTFLERSTIEALVNSPSNEIKTNQPTGLWRSRRLIK